MSERHPSALATVVRVQWLILRRDRLVWGLLGLFVGLLTYAGVSGTLQSRDRDAQHTTVLADESARFRALEETLTQNPPPPPSTITTQAWRPNDKPADTPAVDEPDDAIEPTEPTPDPAAEEPEPTEPVEAADDEPDEITVNLSPAVLKAAVRFNTMRYNRTRWRQIQVQLGVPKELADGLPGPSTAKAIAAFQQKQDLDADGKAGKGTLERLDAEHPPKLKPEPKPASKPAPRPDPKTAQDTTRPPQDPDYEPPILVDETKDEPEPEPEPQIAKNPTVDAPRPGVPESEPYRVGNDLGRRIAALPSGPLASLTMRDGAERPGLYVITLESQLKAPETASRPINQGRLSLGMLDMAFVLLYILPLLVIALTYDLLLGEREQQTLAVVLSYPVSPGTFILGKMLTRAALIVAVAVVPAVVFWLMTAPMDGRGAVAVALATLAVVSYIAFWLAAAMVTNAWMKASAASALALMGLWLFCLVLVPGMIQLGVEALYPPPSRVTLVNLSRQAARDAENTLMTLEGNHGKNPGGTKDARAFLNRKVKAHQHMGEAMEGVLGEFDQQLQRQQGLVRWLQVLSPAVVLREGFSELAGDGVTRHQNFKAQARLYHEGWQAFFFERIQRNEPITAKDIQELPEFTFAPEELDHIAWRVLVGLVGIWVPTLLLLFAALSRVRTIGRL